MKKFKDINRLKEDSMDSTTMSSPEGNQFRGGYTPASRTFTEKPQKEPMKKYKEVKEDSEIDIPKDAPSVEAIAKKHGVSVAEIEKQLKIGMSVEAEHGKNKGSEREIAMDHLNEKPNYYTKLKKYVEETEVNEMLKPKMSSLDKWRASATKREKMHNDIEKNRQANASQGKENMSDTITKLSKSLNKEEVELDEGKWGYPKSMTTIPKYDKDADDYLALHQGAKFARKNKENRKEWRKAAKAQAHQKLMSGVKEETEMKNDPCWKNYQMVGKKMKNGKEVPNCVPVKEAKEEDGVGEMIKDKLKIIINRAQEMHDEITDAKDMPEWVKSKVTLAQDYISTACDYSCGKEQLGEESNEKHWDKGYEYAKDHAIDSGFVHTASARKKQMLADNPHKKGTPEHSEWHKGALEGHSSGKRELHGESVEQIAELSKSTLGSYVKKATSSSDKRSMSNLSSRAAHKLNNPVDQDEYDDGDRDDHKSFLRSKGVSKAVDRITKEEVEELDEAPVVIKTNKEIGAKVTSIGPGGKETVIKTDPAYSKAEQEKKKIEEVTIAGSPGWKLSPGTVTDKSGAKHSPMSRARDLARLALNKKAKSLKPVKEEKEESRKAGIVKDVVKSAKKKKSDSTKAEKFESDPVLSSEIQKQ